MTGPQRPTTIAVFGDIGGHLDRFVDALEDLDVDVDGAALPDGLCVIQVGDLIHKGPDSDDVIDLVDRFLTNGAAWIQLAGNHEAHHLGGPRFWGVQVSPSRVDTLRRWDRDELIGSAAAVVTDSGQQWLITHAGLVDGTWVDLGAPGTAADAAAGLNDWWRRDRSRATRAGLMLGGGPGPAWPDDHVSVTWAEPTWELYEGWMRLPVPFHQIHGHASAYDWRRRRWTSSNLEQLAAQHRASVNRRLHHTRVQFNGGTIVGIDAQYGRLAERPLRPHLLTGTVTAQP
jgi:hypothetical protein